VLFLLTGDKQTGKTRWLGRRVEELELRGFTLYGVLAPGVWVTHKEAAGETAYEKIGIDNVLLPEQERIPFARRRDLAEREEGYDAQSQSARAELNWAIDDQAIELVNRHFDKLTRLVSDKNMTGGRSSCHVLEKNMTEGRSSCHVLPVSGQGLLVVDELGYLELVLNQGLSSAFALLMAGPTALYEHALVVAKAPLCELAEERLAPSWQTVTRLLPDESGRERLLSLLSVSRGRIC